MRERDHKHAGSGPKDANDELDSLLDAALSKYTAVEPRPGLDDRVLANLHAEQGSSASRASWQWSLAALALAVVLLAVASAWRTRMHTQPVAQHRSTPQVTTQETGGDRRGANAVPRNASRSVHKAHRHQSPPDAVAAANPKLDQFPSPQPLTEQERILVSYVARFHDQAVLVARVADLELEKDRLAVFGNPQSNSGPGEQNQQTTHP